MLVPSHRVSDWALLGEAAIASAEFTDHATGPEYAL